MGTIFIAGTYGVGKSTLCNKLSKILNVREYSAGDLISAVNGENYGANKVVSDKETNQKILALQVKKLHEVSPNIILAGHFCLFGADGNVECLPDEIFCDLAIDNIILLEASLSQIISNLFVRDKKKYSEKQILALQTMERQRAHEISILLNCNVYVHKMNFDETDVDDCISYLKKGNEL